MKKMLINTPLFIILCLFFKSNLVSSQPQTTLVAPLNKDTTTSLYTLTLSGTNRYVVDITAIFSWQQCPLQPPPPVTCFTSPCIQAQYLSTPYCSIQPPEKSGDPCFCMVTPSNPVAKTCALDRLISTNLTVSWADGASPPAKINTFLSCAPRSLFRSLPRRVVGLASLSSFVLSLHSQISDSFPKVRRKFAMCLPSTGSGNGVIFFGDGPYNLIPGTNIDASSLVSYTPLLISPRNVQYAIGIKALSVSGHSIPMSPFEGITLTTVVPYTTLRTDIYNQFIKFFVEGMKGIPRTKNVAPFRLCYNATAIGYSRVGLHVPQIDLEFDSGKNWTIYGSNSMKQVGGDVACLAILDGGENQTYKVTIGSFQMEENLLVFDDEGSRFGFSSSLYFERISCGNFDFKTKV